MKETERVALIVSIVALILNLLTFPLSGFFTVISLSILLVIYFSFGFAFFNEIRFSKILDKANYKDFNTSRLLEAAIAGLGLSITIFGLILFVFQLGPPRIWIKSQFWFNASIILGVGLAILLVVVLVWINKYKETKSRFYARIIKRAAIFGGLGLLLLVLPSTTVVDFKYRNHPAYLEALKKSLAHPCDTTLYNIALEESYKMERGKREE